MPLDVVRLRDSDLAATPDGEVFRAAILSWCTSWHQLPAASLPDDDAVLARLLGYGRDVKGWAKLRAAGALRGFVKCSDGRLYHPVVAEKAITAWDAKQSQRNRTEKARMARLSQSRETPVTDNVTGSNGEREGKRESLLRSENAPAETLTPSEPIPSKQKPEKNQGTRWPPEGRVPFEWHEDAQAACHDSGLDPPDLRLEAGKFERYWASKPGAAGRKVDWRKTFINWIIKAAEDAAKRSKTGRKPTSTDTHLSVLAEIFSAEDGRSQGVPKHGQLALPAAKPR